MTSKAEFLQRIRESLADIKQSPNPPQLPEPPEVWPIGGLSVEEMKTAFAENLRSVAGECVFCENREQAAQKIADLLQQAGVKRVAIFGREAVQEVAKQLSTFELIGPPTESAMTDPKECERWDASILAPEYLLADSGSALFEAKTPFERLTVYLPPLCIVIATVSQLREHLPHAWKEFAPCWKTERQGEFVIVTGPSRTADIEKKLVLGVHGPKKLVVFLCN